MEGIQEVTKHVCKRKTRKREETERWKKEY